MLAAFSSTIAKPALDSGLLRLPDHPAEAPEPGRVADVLKAQTKPNKLAEGPARARSPATRTKNRGSAQHTAQCSRAQIGP
jgi:hypothetical protein